MDGRSVQVTKEAVGDSIPVLVNTGPPLATSPDTSDVLAAPRGQNWLILG